MLEEILMKEQSHKQWGKHLLCAIVLGSQVIVNLIRGSKNNESILMTFFKIPYARC